MPALFPGDGASDGAAFQPIAQLGAGPDGTVVLARRGGQLVEIHQLAFGPGTPRWAALETRVRAIGQVRHPSIRAVLGLDLGEHREPDLGSKGGREAAAPPSVALEGDSFPAIAESIDQGAVDLVRALRILGELARALAAAHRAGLFHGRIHPWSVWVGTGDRPHIELLGVATRSIHEPAAARCLAPEYDEARPDAAADVFAVGTLLDLFAARRNPDAAIRAIVADATAADPEARPAMAELEARLHGAAAGSNTRVTLQDEPSAPPRPAVGASIGRYELSRQLGAGAMGEVWHARDTAGGPDVALKLLRPAVARDGELLRRFRKEARVLARVGSPYIANVLDLNEDRGVHYLALELVPGGSVGAALKRLGTFPEALALAVAADACRALAEPHRLGIVHRDLKPDNMMFVREGIELESPGHAQLVKLGDFGIARAVEAEEGATREGAVLGTPEYMAPEQCQGTTVTPATDVYALGCCLFAMIAGRPPFVAPPDNHMQVILSHLREPPPALAAASPAVAELVARCLAKDAKARPQDAAEVLAAIEALSGGTAALVAAHPAPPVFRASRVVSYSFEWELASPPDALWPYVSDTDRLNRAAGLAPVRFAIETTKTADGSITQTGTSRAAGGAVSLKWREHPYEWIEGSRHVVLRVFDGGLLRWYVAEVSLERTPAGGTKLRNTIKLEPRGWLARFLARFDIGIKYRRNLDRVYRRLDRTLAAGTRPEISPLDPEIAVTPAARARIAKLGEELREARVDDRAADALGAFLSSASDQDVARIRPLELAAKFGVPEDAMIAATLHAAKSGALQMVWDVICPSCRIPSSVVDSLAKIEEHGRCTACNLGFTVDFSRAIELAFRAAPEIREVETRTYCVGGPAHFPHVAAQVRLAPGERFALPLTLPAGFYQIRSPQLARAHDLRVTGAGGVRRADLLLGERADLPPLTAGDQLLTLVNPEQREVLVRVERAGDRAFALTAARVASSSAFRELFPDQALAPGRLLAVTQVTLVAAQLDEAAQLFRELGDAKAFPVAARFFEAVTALAREHGGSLVKTFGGLALLAFERPRAAVEAARQIQAALDAHALTRELRARVAVHRGPMMALTQAGRLDYFGQVVEQVVALAADTPPGEVTLTSAVCQDEAVADAAAREAGSLVALPGGAWAVHVRAVRRQAPSTVVLDA